MIVSSPRYSGTSLEQTAECSHGWPHRAVCLSLIETGRADTRAIRAWLQESLVDWSSAPRATGLKTRAPDTP